MEKQVINFLSINEFKKRTNLAPRTIEVNCESGSINAIRSDKGRWIIPESEIEKFNNVDNSKYVTREEYDKIYELMMTYKIENVSIKKSLDILYRSVNASDNEYFKNKIGAVI